MAEHHERWLVASLTIFGAALRLFELGNQSLWYDELYTAFVVRNDWPRIIAILIQSDVHPPLSYLLIRLATLFGNSETELRIVPSLFSIVTIPLFYVAIRQWFDRRIATVAALLLVLDPFQVLFAQEARMYAQLAFFTLAAQICFRSAWQTGRARDWILFAIATTLAFYTHNLACLNLLALDLWALWRTHELPARLRPLAATHLLVVAFFLPWVPAAWQQLTRVSTGFWGTAPTVLNLLTTPYLLLFGTAVPFVLVPVALFIGLALLGFALVSVARVLGGRQPEAASLGFAVLIFCVPLVTLFLLAQVRPVFVERTLIVTTFGLLAIIAWAIVRAPPRALMLVFAGAIGIVLLSAFPQYYFNPEVQKPDFRAAAADLSVALVPGDTVVHTSDSSALAFAYYLPSTPAHFLAGDPDFEQNTERGIAGRYVGLSPEPFASLVQNHARLWLVVALDHNQDYQQAQLALFDKTYGRITTHNVDGILLMLYRLDTVTAR